MIHGHKKGSQKKSEEQIQQQTALSDKISANLAEFFEIRRQPILPHKINSLLEFTSILMQLCNDISTIFNFRRQLINHILENASEAEERAKIIGADIKIVSRIMQQDPKSYTLWSYRQWLVMKLYQIDKSIVEKEKQLCKMMLNKDEKNFHVWNYRNWVNSIDLNLDQELQFTKTKIDVNPFNYSPYHFRSKFLTRKYQALQVQECDQKTYHEICTYGMLKRVFDEELEMVKTAIMVRPNEEAPWLYFNWLLKQLLPIIVLKNTSQNALHYILLFSLKIENFQQIIQTDKQYTLKCYNSSQNWEIEFQEQPSHFQILDNSYMPGMGKRVISSKHTPLKQIQSIFEDSIQFIREVIESEENQCRFGWLNILELYKCLLYLGVSHQQWSEITCKGLQTFEHLQKEQKGAKYIIKQAEHWKNLNKTINLTDIEQALYKFRDD